MKPRINSRTKGHSFERLIAQKLRPYYPSSRRGLQYQDGANCPDVVETPFHIECKRGRKVNIRKALEQARRDTQGAPILVVSQEDRAPITVTMEWPLFEAILFKLTGRTLAEEE